MIKEITRYFNGLKLHSKKRFPITVSPLMTLSIYTIREKTQSITRFLKYSELIY